MFQLKYNGTFPIQTSEGFADYLTEIGIFRNLTGGIANIEVTPENIDVWGFNSEVIIQGNKLYCYGEELIDFTEETINDDLFPKQ